MILPDTVLYVIDQIMHAGGQAFLVGGALRDHLLGRIAVDYDIAASLSPEEIEEVFRHKKTYSTGKRFGTITVAAGGLLIEVTTFRQESGYADSRHPDVVTFVSDIVPDLSRRDFTINAIAYNPRIDSGLIDPFHGMEDLKKGIIRTVGSPRERFEEDPLRILRGIRFAAQLNFRLEDETKQATSECRQLLKHVSRERVRDELIKILLSPHPDMGVLLLKDAGILPILLKPADGSPTQMAAATASPEDELYISEHTKSAPNGITRVKASTDGTTHVQTASSQATEAEIEENETAHLTAVLTEKEAQIIKYLSAELDCRLAALLTMLLPVDTQKSEPQQDRTMQFTTMQQSPGADYSAQLSSVLQNLRLDRKCINHVICLVKGYTQFCSMEITPYLIRKLLGEYGVADTRLILQWYKIAQGIYEDTDMESKHSAASQLLDVILADRDPVFRTDLAINGDDILNAGIGTQDGRLVGEALNMAYEWVLEDPGRNHVEYLVNALRKQFGIL